MFTPFITGTRNISYKGRWTRPRICAIAWGIALLFPLMLYAQQSVKTGVEVLVERNFKAIEGMRVGLITNATGVNSELISTIDLLNDAENVHLVALYGPEHGVRGDYAAGDKVESYTDQATGLPVFSLYGAIANQLLRCWMESKFWSMIFRILG